MQNGGGRETGFQHSLAEFRATSLLFNQFTSRRRTDQPNAAPIIRESPSTNGSRGFEDPLTTAELNNAFLAAKTLQHDADLVLRRKIPPRRAVDFLHKLFRWLLQQPGFLAHRHCLTGADAGAVEIRLAYSPGYSTQLISALELPKGDHAIRDPPTSGHIYILPDRLLATRT
jgi:hypothetical protein